MVSNLIIQFCYSILQASMFTNMMWTFLQSVHTPPISENENKITSCSNFYFNGSNQETKDIQSPSPLNLVSFDCHLPAENDTKFKSRSDKNKKLKNQIEEQEFKPNAPEIKKGRRTPQNANRNVIPNIMHQKVKSGALVAKLLEKQDCPQNCSVKRFYLYQILIKEKLNNYVNVESLSVLNQLQQPGCQVYSEAEQRHYNKISRLLVHYFLTQEYNTIILTSKRVSSDKKQDHLMMKRKILEQFNKILLE